MADVFRIETNQTSLSWTDELPATASDGPTADGRLAISLRQQADKNINVWRRGLPAEVGNNLQVEVGPRVFEATTYNLLLRGSGAKHVELRHRDPAILQTLHSSPDRNIVYGDVNFRNEIGRSRFAVYAEGRAEYEFEIEVFPTRLDYANDYAALTADIEEIQTGLVLEYLRSTYHFGFASASESSSRLEWTLMLRHVINDLERALHYIEQHPHHGMTRERVPTRVERIRRPDATIRKMILQGKGQGAKFRTSSGRVLHERLPERRSLVTLDTPEHRWLATQLTRIRKSLAEIQLRERKRGTQQTLRGRRVLEEIAELEDRIATLQKLAPLADAKGLAPAGFTSLVLQSRPGYREAYRACLILLQALRANSGQVGLSMKETDQLYEYWCYLALIRLIAKLTGERIPAQELFSIEENGLMVRLKHGTTQTVRFSQGDRSLELTYNPRYKLGALILPQQPTVVRAFRDPRRHTMWIVCEAKYGLNPELDYVTQVGSPGPPLEAIDVLHRYRDLLLIETGLQDVNSETMKDTYIKAVTLFPYADLEDRFRDNHFWSRLQRSGIGAAPFLPTETQYLEEWLRLMLQRAGWLTNEKAVSPPMFVEQLRAWQKAEREPVLIAPLGRNANERLEWIKTNRRFYTPLSQREPRQLLSRSIAFYATAPLRTPDAITHLAQVEGFEIKKRGEIETPWSSERNPDEEQVVYRLSEVRELKQPIENRGPEGIAKFFARNRWTSRLALIKAIELRELFMETSAEWLLYEQLRDAKLDFTLKPDALRRRDPNDPRSKSWFVRKHLRVQYRGAAGFLIRRNGMRDEYKSDLAEVFDYFARA